MNRIEYTTLKFFVIRAMKKIGCPDEKADVVAEVLVEADARGISSHGVARLKRYLDHIRDGTIDVNGEPKVVFESPTAEVIDGNRGIGQWISKKAVESTIARAEGTGVSFTAVRNSNHFGIAGYYAELAARRGMIGIASTNTAPLVVPTFGREAILGTNPIAVAIPTEDEIFLLDMATSVAARGKVEVYARSGKELPGGWAVDENGEGTIDPTRVLSNLAQKTDGGILPLGGSEESSGGHKGYGLALLVELLTSGLSFGDDSSHTYSSGGKICHFFGAIKLDQFGSVQELQGKMKTILDGVRSSRRAIGHERIYIHGEKERERLNDSLSNGVLLDEKTVSVLKAIAQDLEILWPL